MANKIVKNKKSYMLGKQGSLSSQAGDEAALEALYTSTNGGSWTDNTGWASSGMSLSDSIYGVTTASINGELRVTEINLYNNGLTGSLPVEIGNLKELIFWNSKQNAITGSIPSEIGSWTKIENLFLSGTDTYASPTSNYNIDYHMGKSDASGNDFSGEFPDVWANFTSLINFELSGSSLTRLFHDSINNCTSLKRIWACWNTSLTENLPSSMGNLTQMEDFKLRASVHTGTLPTDMSNWTLMKQFHIGNGNDFTGDVPDFSGWTSLRNWNVDNNNFNGEWPQYWNNGNFTQLDTLRATWNSFTGTLHGFENLTGLIVFAVTGNDFTGSIPASATLMVDCKLFEFGWCYNMEGQIPQTGWENWTQPRIIRFQEDEAFTGNIPDSLGNISTQDLSFINLNNNLFETMGSNLANLGGSAPVDVHGNKLTFKSLVPVYNGLGGRLTYAPQKAFGSASNYDSGTGIIDFSGVVTHVDNNYTWYRSTDSGSTFSTITGETTNILDTSTYNTGDQFYLEVTNTGAPNLTLNSITITI